jgi:hypothetical protein
VYAIFSGNTLANDRDMQQRAGRAEARHHQRLIVGR